MRSMKLVALGALSLLSLAGCLQGQPRLYRVAVDATPVRTIAVPSCFRNNNLPAGRGNITEQNYRSEDEWVIWTGVTNTAGDLIEYLDLGNQTFNLGDAPTITVADLIEGFDDSKADGAGVFSALRNVQKPIGDQYVEARQTQISVKFNDYSAVPVGTISLNSQYACIKARADCPVGDASPQDAASCSSSLSFVARRIEVSQHTEYNNNP